MYFIAEIGVNHNGSFDIAKKMIDAAQNSGANCVKFQSFDAAKLARVDTPKVDYQKHEGDASETHFQMLSRLQFNRGDMEKVYGYCTSVGIDFISTPYDVPSAQSLYEMGCRVFKTASADIVDFQLHTYLSKWARKVLISLGMATLGEIEEVLRIYEESNVEIVLLHCISNYPCSDKSVNMDVIKTIKSAFDLEVGFSDHTLGSIAGVMSVCFGSRIIEKHFTLSKDLVGPDHAASSTPAEFRDLVVACLRAKDMMGTSSKSLQSEEVSMRYVSRKSIYALSTIMKDSLITSRDLGAIRPGIGLSPMLMPVIIGSRASKTIHKDQFISYGDFYVE